MAAPHIKSLSPNHGPIAGGTIVEMLADNAEDPESVIFSQNGGTWSAPATSVVAITGGVSFVSPPRGSGPDFGITVTLNCKGGSDDKLNAWSYP